MLPIPSRRRPALLLLPCAALAACLALAGCAVPTGPVAVTRFHLADTAPLGHGTIALVPAPGMDPASLELGAYTTAVGQQLARLGYQVLAADDPAAATSTTIAELRLARATDGPASPPVRVGGAASAGSYGSAVGLGVTFNLSGNQGPQTTSELGVVLRERASGRVLWEGKALFTVAAGAPLATTPLAAPRLAAALFTGFPGNSGETIQLP